MKTLTENLRASFRACVILRPFCSDCGARLRMRNPGVDTWTATCPDCYDGTEDSSERERLIGVGDDAAAAQSDWHERRSEI